MAAEAQRAPSVRERTNLHPAPADGAAVLEALGAFSVDRYNPFYADPNTATGLMSEARGIAKLLASAYRDNHNATQKGVECELDTLNGNFFASAMDGIGSLIALAMFLQEQADG